MKDKKMAKISWKKIKNVFNDKTKIILLFSIFGTINQ